MRRCVATTGAMAESKWKLLMLEPWRAQPARRAIHMNRDDKTSGGTALCSASTVHRTKQGPSGKNGKRGGN